MTTTAATTLPPRADMLAALEARDASCDGLFYAAVSTTGVFCRPSCPARHPRPEHVTFYATAPEALQAGYRPCRRCHPLEQRGSTPPWMTALIARVEAEPWQRIRDEDLRAEGLDPAAVRRRFRRSLGMTFQQYSRARRLGQAVRALGEGDSVDEVVFAHGWSSHSGFRAAFTRSVGAPPGEVAMRLRGASVPPVAGSPAADTGASPDGIIRLSWIVTPLGGMIAGATDEAVCLLEFADQPRTRAQLAALSRALSRPLARGDGPLLDALRAQLDEYFAGSRRTFDLPIDAPGSEFQRLVWDRLRQIPYGATLTYASLARELGRPAAARAVGSANAANRIAIVIPCHRVVAAGGGLGGYGGGLWRKLRLLETEGAAPHH